MRILLASIQILAAALALDFAQDFATEINLQSPADTVLSKRSKTPNHCEVQHSTKTVVRGISTKLNTTDLYVVLSTSPKVRIVSQSTLELSERNLFTVQKPISHDLANSQRGPPVVL